MAQPLITAVEITAYDEALPGTRTLYYSSGELITGPSDTPAHIAFDDRILTAPNFVRRAFGNARITSGGQATYGVLELANTDHALSFLLDLGLDGREIVVRVGRAGTAYPAAWTIWLTGTVEQPEVGADKVTLRIRDRTAVLDLPLQSTLYAGTNTGGPLSGAEGVPTDIGGQPKPLAWGRCSHVPAVRVNTALDIFQVHAGQVQAIDAVYDRGAALSFAANRANLAALEAASVSAGQFDTCTALGLFRLGGPAQGRVTADIRGDAAGSYVDRAGAVMRRILESVCGIATADIDTAAFAALDVAAPYEIGIWIGAETTRRAVLDQIQASIGAFCLPDRTGIWTTAQLTAPTGTPVATITDADINTLDREATKDPGRGVPAWKVTLRYKPHFASFSESDLVAPGGALSEAARHELLQPWRTSVATDTAVQTKHLHASTIEADTLLTTKSDADAESARRLALHKVRRDYALLGMALTDENAGFDLASQLLLETPLLGYDAGRQMVILGLTRENDALKCEMWG